MVFLHIGMRNPKLAATRFLLGVAIQCGLTVYAFPDTITLKSGSIISGVISSKTGTQVSIKTTQGVVTLSMAAVQTIEQSPIEEQRLKDIETALRGGKLDSVYSSLSPLTSNSEQTSAVELLDMSAQSLLRNRDAVSPETTKLISDWARKYPQRLGLQTLAAVLNLKTLDSNSAFAALERVPHMYFAQAPWAADAIQDALETAIAEKLAAGGTHELFELIEKSARFTTTANPSSTATVLLRFAAARKLAASGETSRAIELVGLEKATPALSAAKFAMGLFQAAVEKHELPVGIVEAGDMLLKHFAAQLSPTDLTFACRASSQAALTFRDYNKAVTFSDSLSKFLPDAGAHLQHEIEFQRRKAMLKSDDPLGRYRLGVWAREMGLIDEARSLITPLLSHKLLAENVRLQIDLIDLQDGLRELEKLEELLQHQHYGKVVEGCRQFKRRYADPSQQKKATDFEELAKYRLWAKSSNAEGLAEAALQTAERLMLQRRYQECIEQLNRIKIEFPGRESEKRVESIRTKVELYMKQSPQTSN